MKGDVRARILMKLLDEMPEGIAITKNAEPRCPYPEFDELVGEDEDGEEEEEGSGAH